MSEIRRYGCGVRPLIWRLSLWRGVSSLPLWCHICRESKFWPGCLVLLIWSLQPPDIEVLCFDVTYIGRRNFGSGARLMSVHNLIFTTEPPNIAGRNSLVGSNFAWESWGTVIDPHVWHILLWRFGHENISTAILPLPLIQEEHLSVNGQRMCAKYWQEVSRESPWYW